MTFNTSLVPNVSLISGGIRIPVRRYSDVEFVKGRAQLNKFDSFEIVGNIQPLTGDEVLRLAEGDRTKDHINIWTKGKLLKKDEITYNGNCYSVENIEEWQTYRQVRAVRIDVQRVP